jgi:tetratricopeptide (TPR) repeat protein/mono/diheme cytochrome c family protein
VEGTRTAEARRDSAKPPAVVAAATQLSEAPAKPTFTRDVAPLVYKHCASCHRPGEAAPFPLLDYAEVRERAGQIADVVGRRYMPPWLAEPGIAHYVGERRLSDAEIKTFVRWAADGAPEGDPKDLPQRPEWPEGWQLGKPDLVVEMPTPFAVKTEGLDVYQNFVLPVPVDRRKYVSAVELRPGNYRVAHHGLMRIDDTPNSRARDEETPEPGFDGMETPSTVFSPDGFFMSWQPGRVPVASEEGLSWKLDPGTDLVVQMHMQPTGKPEELKAAVGLYFADKPPTKRPFKLLLRSLELDIAPGENNFVVEDSYKLPVDVEMLSILPHAHYLGKRIEALAELPTGETKHLLLIKDWDFNWHTEYRLQEPIKLPTGTTLRMRFSYDNSAENPRNPSHPPKRVVFGANTTDEMAELWLQVLPASDADYAKLDRDYRYKSLADIVKRSELALANNPLDAIALMELGKAKLVTGDRAEAARYFQQAQRAKPDFDEPRYYLGVMLLEANKPNQATKQFEAALAANPQNHQAHGYLGLIAANQGRLPEAEQHLRDALKIQDDDLLARFKLAEVLAAQKQTDAAIKELERILQQEPNNAGARAGLEKLQGLEPLPD